MVFLDELRRYLERLEAPISAGAQGGEVAEYARRIYAVRLSGDNLIVTPIGQILRELTDRDAIRWLLAAEVVQSDGLDDEWRMSREAAIVLLKHSQPDAAGTRERPEPPIARTLVHRLSRMGVVTAGVDEGEQVVDDDLLSASGRLFLRELASGKDTPFTLLVQAVLHDETMAVLARFRPAGMVARMESSADAAARHARMVAHEIRNALVPVQSAVESLYRDLERLGARDPVEKRRDTIDAGIARVFRFLRDISRIADHALTPSDLFEVTSAVQAAIAAVVSDFGGTILFEPQDALPAVKGHRDRFVLAIINVLRNAVQVGQRDTLEIRVSTGTHNGAEVFVAVEDNGPGVPPEHRKNIFEPGFSLRPEGTGQGLALVREVIEAEMAGRALCEQSELGGARIVLRLPVGAKRNK